MKVVVPTFMVRATLREEVTVKGKTFKPGAVVSMAYGIAVQGMARGVVGAIVDADKTHDDALIELAKWGSDAWFPQNLQSVQMLFAAIEAQDATVH